MDPVLTIARNIKRLRTERQLSLEGLAKASGVSKSMLAQIERGDVNPTIGTLWKIAAGLKLPFSELLEKPASPFELVDTAKISPLLEDGGRYRNYPLFLFEDDRRFELYSIVMDHGSRNEAQAHPAGTEEYVVVHSGKLAVSTDNGDIIVDSGCAARFRADTPHVYVSMGAEACRFCMLIYYPK